MPLVDVENYVYDDVVVPFLDVAVCDDNESLIHSIRSGSSEMPSVTPEPSGRMSRRQSFPASVVTSIPIPGSEGESDDELSCTHSVRTTSSGRRGPSARSRLGSRILSSITSIDSLSVDEKFGNTREPTIELAVVGDDSDVSEGDRLTYLEEEVTRLNSDLATSRSKHAIAKVRSRQLSVELEDMEAFCKKLQEENQKLLNENAALKKNGIALQRPRWFGHQPQKTTDETDDASKKTQNVGMRQKTSECAASVAATEETAETTEWAEDRTSGEYTDLPLEDVVVDNNTDQADFNDSTKETKRPWWSFGGPTPHEAKVRHGHSGDKNELDD